MTQYICCAGGPCNQGRKPCPTPQACLMEVDDDTSKWGHFKRAVLVPFAIGLGVSVILMGGLFAYLYVR